MTKTTYVVTAPDGSQHTRKTDRTYTHAVLLEGKEGWGIAGFCGRLDLAHKKQTEHPDSIVVEVQVFGAAKADTHEPEVSEDADPTEDQADDAHEREPSVDDTIRNVMVTGPKCIGTIGELVHELLMDVDLSYIEIVSRVKVKFPDAKTTSRSVASVAAVLRKKGTPVPVRRRVKAP